MTRWKIKSLLGSILLVICVMFTPSAASPSAFAKATKTTHAAVSASVYNNCPLTQQQGSSGTWVRALQYRLNELSREGLVGFGSLLSTDGSFGRLTANAVYQYQAMIRLWGQRPGENWVFVSLQGPPFLMSTRIPPRVVHHPWHMAQVAPG